MIKRRIDRWWLAGIALCSACSIHPVAWQPEKPPPLAGRTALNEHLANATAIDLQGWFGPEDIVSDSIGNLYCGVHNADFTDGRILRIDTAGRVSEHYAAGSWVAGLHFDHDGNLIALSHREGLISISPQKQVTVLADRDGRGNRFRIPNGLDIGTDGQIYFTNTSAVSGYTPDYGRKLILEMRPQGALYRYDPRSGSLTTLIDGTYFGNGVVLSRDETYLLVVETIRYRVLKYWLVGERQGQTDILMDNLPGFPNGISIRPDGTYWLGFTTRRNEALDNIHPKPWLKKVVWALPGFLQPKAERFGMVMNINGDGEIIETLFDSQGLLLPEAGAVKEYSGYLYIGGDELPHIAQYRLAP